MSDTTENEAAGPAPSNLKNLTVDDIIRAEERLKVRDAEPYVRRAYWRGFGFGLLAGVCLTSLGVITTVLMR